MKETPGEWQEPNVIRNKSGKWVASMFKCGTYPDHIAVCTLTINSNGYDKKYQAVQECRNLAWKYENEKNGTATR